MVLNDVADMCYFADTEAYIEITSEYVVDTLSDKQHSEKKDNLHHRVYSYSDGLKRNADIDRKYIEKVKETIKEDIGLDFQSFIDALSYFSNLFSDEIVDKIGSNVFRGAYNELLNDFLMQMDGAITKEEAIGIFNYLVVCLLYTSPSPRDR